MADNDEKYDNEGGFVPGRSCKKYYLCSNSFRVIHISNHDCHSPVDQFINESLQMTNSEYSLQTLQDRSTLPNNLFDNYDSILVSTWSSINEEILGNLLADAVDAGKNVVILLFSNTLSYKHPKGRFMKQNYNATTRVANLSKDDHLGTIHNTNHPIMNNVNKITLGTEKRRSMGKIADNQKEFVNRIADWSDGNVFIAIRHNKPGLITEITCSFGVNGAKSDAKRLLNNALRLNRSVPSIGLPSNILNIISNSNFGIIPKIQQQFTLDEIAILQNNSDFKGWVNVYNDISNQFGKILTATFDKISKQVQHGTQQQINDLMTKKDNCMKEIENTKAKFKELNLPNKTIQDSIAPLLEYVKTLQTEIDQWKNKQINTNKLIGTCK